MKSGGQLRLQKYLARAGVGSRRSCEKLILDARVKVDGKTVTELGYMTSDGSIVELDGCVVQSFETKVYILMNKPVGCITSSKDQFGRETVVDLVRGETRRLFPVGRLDYHTSGLLLLTNDGEFSNLITHPKNEIEKVYEVTVKGEVTEEQLVRLRTGVVIGSGSGVSGRGYGSGNSVCSGSGGSSRVGGGSSRVGGGSDKYYGVDNGAEFKTSPAIVWLSNSVTRERSLLEQAFQKDTSRKQAVQDFVAQKQVAPACLAAEGDPHKQAAQKQVAAEGNSQKQAAQKQTLGNQSEFSLVTILIHEGKNRQVRRMFEAVGLKVCELQRIAIGGLGLSGLKAGEWKYITLEEAMKAVTSKFDTNGIISSISSRSQQ